jgi:hypothetical protein
MIPPGQLKKEFRVDFIKIFKKEDIMRVYRFCIAIFLVLLFTMSGLAQIRTGFETATFYERNLSGPRLGVTLIPGSGELASKLKERGIGPTLSQFGWHFEWQVVPENEGPSFVIETIPLVAGVEYGKVVPSITLAMGVRMPSGIEFGMGPNLLFGGEKLIYSALVIAVGKSFNYSGVSIPINLVFTTNPAGNRFSLIFGYAIAD